MGNGKELYGVHRILTLVREKDSEGGGPCPMRIAMIASCPYDPNQGVCGATLGVANGMRGLGATVDTYFMDHYQLFAGGRVDRVLFPWFVAMNRRLLALYDVLDIASGDAWVLAPILRKPLLVVRSHGLEHIAHKERLMEPSAQYRRLGWHYHIYGGAYRLWEVGLSLRSAEIAVFLNNMDKAYATSTLGVDPGRSYVVPNGLDDAFIGRPMNACRLSSHDGVGIAIIGSYINRKGIQYSVPALEAILRKYSWVKVGFFGTGCPPCVVTRDFSDAVTSRVHVVSSYTRQQLPGLLANYHLQVFASLSEGFGMGLVEGMACGLAPIVSDASGPIDIVENNQNGLIVPRRDAASIFQAVAALLDNLSTLQLLRERALASVQGLAWRSIAVKTLEIYRRGMESKGVGRARLGSRSDNGKEEQEERRRDAYSPR